MFPTFVINLPRDSERRAHIESELARVGLDATFVPGLDGDHLTPDDLARYDERKCRRVYGVDMVGAELGCYLSHYRLFQHVVDEELDAALILEDDVTFEDDVVDVLQKLEDLRRDWKVVRLSTMRRSLVDRAPDRGRDVDRLTHKYRILRLRTHVLGASAYVITRTGALRMLDYGRRIFMPIDQTMDRFWENGIVPYVIFPFPVHHGHDFVSRIGERDPRRRYQMPQHVLWQRRLTRLSDSVRKRIFNVLQP